MAVVYETGNATDPVDLLDKLRIFCVAQASITVDQYVVDPGEASRQLLSLSFGSGFFTIAYNPTAGDSTTEAYILTQATGFAPGLDFGNQANETPIGTSATTTNLVPNAAISVYHFFYNETKMLFVAFQTNAGVWRQFGVGDLTKFGTYTGGSITMGSYVNTTTAAIDNPYNGQHALFSNMTSTASRRDYIRVDYNAANKMYGVRQIEADVTQAFCSAYNVAFSSNNVYFNATPSSTTQATALNPVQYLINQDITPDKVIPIGQHDDCRIINMQFFNSGDVYDTDWLIFSLGAKRDPSIRDDQLNTGYIGVALRFQNG